MKKILIMGGGEFHDYVGCCGVMARQLKELPEYEVEVSINELDKLKRASSISMTSSCFTGPRIS